MRLKHVWLFIAFVLGLISSAHSADQIPTITLDWVAHFTAPDGSDVTMPPSTYRIEQASKTALRVTGDQASSMLHAMPIHHEVPLDRPHVLVIQEEESDQNVLHLLLLRPDGEGLDATGTVRLVQTRGGDFGSQALFSAKPRYTGVLMQQGRVQTDADWVEPGGSSSPAGPGSQSQAKHFGRVTLEQGRVQLDAEARRTVLQGCKLCAIGP
jgi:hypothetical protein